jgi:pimeloyl-ACP methyl ester carboxylesterase
MTGQSIGCQVILRYLAQLPAEARVGGFLAVGCWLTLDKRTRRRRSFAIDKLLDQHWAEFQPWLAPGSIDFEVRGGGLRMWMCGRLGCEASGAWALGHIKGVRYG